MAGMMAVLKRNGGVARCKDGEALDPGSSWDVDCDILIPAALEGQITPVRAERIKAKLVLEGGERPRTDTRDRRLSS